MEIDNIVQQISVNRTFTNNSMCNLNDESLEKDTEEILAEDTEEIQKESYLQDNQKTER